MNYAHLWQHYDNIKKKYNLTYTDILKQMDVYPSSVYISYLADKNRTPSDKSGTIGRCFRDLLNKNITKIDWSSSTSSYEDKLNEIMVTNHRYITAHPSSKCKDCIQCHKCSINPSIDVNINISEATDVWTHEQLQRMFTIDGIVPTINQINKSMYL